MWKALITEKLDKKMSTLIKGVALVLMLVHHFYGFPEWRLVQPELNFKFLGIDIYVVIRFMTQVCVGLFSFLTGWSYFYNKDKSFKYSLKKILILLKIYWFYLLVIFLPIGLIGGYKFNFIDFIFNLFAVSDFRYITFGWYVYIYIFIMLILPIFLRFSSDKLVYDLTIPFFICFIGSKMTLFNDTINTIITNCFTYFAIALLGYMSVKYKLLDKIKIKTTNKYVITLILLLLLFLRAISRLLDLQFTISLYSILFIVYCLVRLLDGLEDTRLVKTLLLLGEYSLGIWFLHSLFFYDYVSTPLQYLAYMPIFPPFVITLVILLVLPITILLDKLIKKLPF